jgi:hypothetical protein
LRLPFRHIPGAFNPDAGNIRRNFQKLIPEHAPHVSGFFPWQFVETITSRHSEARRAEGICSITLLQ